MNNLLDELVSLLASDSRLVSEGKLVKNKIIELALNLDSTLIKLLISNPSIKKHFFGAVGDVLIFDKVKFQKFVSNKKFLPDSYTSYKNKIGLISEDQYLSDIKDVVLAWPYKDCILEGGQDKEDASRKEIFWSEVLAPDQIDRLLAPKALSNFTRYTKNGEETPQDVSIDENFIIKGNNLIALETLVKPLRNKVKMIYIDPPYNTGSDSFRYNDSFNHSTWLTFMKNRLAVAWQTLRQDGAIFIQCDDNEYPYLKVLCDEIFGLESYEVTLYIQVRFGEKTLSERNSYQKMIEQVLVYKKPEFKPNKETEDYSIDKFEWEIVEKTKGTEVELKGRKVLIFKKGDYEIKKVPASINALKETWASGTVLKANASGKFFNDFIAPRLEQDGLEVLYKVDGIGEDGLGYRYFTGPKREGATKGKFYSGVPITRVEELEEGVSKREKVIPNYRSFAESFGNCRSEGSVEMRSGKKPEEFLKYLIDMATQPNDLVMDFFLGTGGTIAVAMKNGRRFIGIEQMNYGDDDSISRLKNVVDGDSTGISKDVQWEGGGSFVYCEIAKANQIYVDLISEAKTDGMLRQIFDEMKQKAFLSYKVDPKAIDGVSSDFDELNLENKKKLLIEMLDKNMLYVPLSEIDDDTYGISDLNKRLNRQIFG